jgi:hypothetical protein
LACRLLTYSRTSLTSAFYSPDGLEATAPVFAGAPLQLPSPLGQVLATFDNFKALPPRCLHGGAAAQRPPIIA